MPINASCITIFLMWTAGPLIPPGGRPSHSSPSHQENRAQGPGRGVNGRQDSLSVHLPPRPFRCSRRPDRRQARPHSRRGSGHTAIRAATSVNPRPGAARPLRSSLPVAAQAKQDCLTTESEKPCGTSSTVLALLSSAYRLADPRRISAGVKIRALITNSFLSFPSGNGFPPLQRTQGWGIPHSSEPQRKAWNPAFLRRFSLIVALLQVLDFLHSPGGTVQEANRSSSLQALRRTKIGTVEPPVIKAVKDCVGCQPRQ